MSSIRRTRMSEDFSAPSPGESAPAMESSQPASDHAQADNFSLDTQYYAALGNYIEDEKRYQQEYQQQQYERQYQQQYEQPQQQQYTPPQYTPEELLGDFLTAGNANGDLGFLTRLYELSP